MSTTGSKPVRLPNAAVVVIGPPARGKSTLAAKLTAAGLDDNAIVSMDTIRGQVCKLRPCACLNRQDGCVGGEACQCQNARVAKIADERVDTRAREGLGFYVDATNLRRAVRRAHIRRAHDNGLPAVALLAAPMDLDTLLARNAARSRKVPAAALEKFYRLHAEVTVDSLYAEGFDQVVVWDDDTSFEVFPDRTDARGLSGPFAVIADVHGCYYSLRAMLDTLGFDADGNHPDGLIPVLVGDLHDKGGALTAGPWGTGQPEDSGAVKVLRLAMDWVAAGKMLVSDSNHGSKIVRTILRPDNVKIGPALAETLADIDAQPDAADLRARLVKFLGRTPVSLRFRGGPTGEFIVAHAAMIRGFEDRSDREAASVCNYRREFDWQGPETVVVGHVVVDEPRRERAEPSPDTPDVQPGQVLRIDTGAYNGGKLTAWLSDSDTFAQVDTDPRDMPHPDRLTANQSRFANRLVAA